GSGLIVIALFLVSSRKQRRLMSKLVNKLRAGSLKPWALIGGTFGGLFVMTQGLAAGALGVALFTVGVVAGQAISALVVDGIGFMGLAKRRINSLRIGGTALALAGLIVTSEPATYEISWLIVMPFLAGAGTGFQQALNASLGQVAESPIVATLVNFLVGFSLILVTTLVVQAGIDWPASFPSNPLLYIGGVIGVTFIFSQIIVVPKIGALATSIALLFGQLGGSLLLDLIVPVAARGITISTVVGIALVSAGATLVLMKR
ncbi:MAG: hypothetical protein RL198_47, partial [Actinomycetota bacterium]